MLIGGIVNFLLIDLFMKYYGEDISGKIGSAYHYLGISIAVVTTSFAQVYYSKLSAMDSKNEIRKDYSFWCIRLFIIALIGVSIMQIIPNSWDEIILGKPWSGTLKIMKVMSIWMGVMFVSSSLSYIYIKLGRQKEMLFFAILQLGLIYSSIKIPFELGYSDYQCLWYFTSAQVIYYVFAIIIAFYFINKFKIQPDN